MKTKAQAPVQPRKALKGLKVKALFAFISKTEVTEEGSLGSRHPVAIAA
ncbi:hypothetical protein I2483_11960 [Sporosarcina sp. E16_3]|nr:hypothetical protein [Sporosarcina sp. E16_3]MBO0602376.1 hypothetical protein [Sporosarcina sp. E16_3]